ncbi:ABC transporter transmembrane domain-containing protein [Roseovarius sp. CAU 1744]|uniref:ABC transporter transmembrane domain-containing protein n=1 Tax=Roseovarius sp. CAU 1744 TaxID=3140368 RepID=UPI00325BF80E
MLAATLCLNLLALALPLFVLQVFDRVIPFAATETLFYLFVGLCVVALLEFALKWSRAVLLGNRAEKFETKLCEKFVDATLNADPEEFRKTTPASHLDRLGAISQLRGYYGGQARALSIDLPFTAIFVAMIAMIGGWLVMVPLTSLVLLLLFKMALTRAQSKVFDRRKTLDGRRYSFLVEVLSQIRTLKANTMEPQMQRRYELLQKQTADISQDVIVFSGFSQTFGALFSQLAVAGMGLMGGYLVIVNYIGIAELAACMLLNGRTVQPMLKALSLWAQSESLSMAREKIIAACNTPRRPDAPLVAARISGHIQFCDLSMKYPDRNGYVLRNLVGQVRPGECLVVDGHSGSGKSTLMKLLLAERSPTDGKVLIDGKPAAHFATLRGPQGIVYCDQNPVIFSGTVLENISSFGDGELIERSLQLSERLGLDKILHRLPMGYNTPLHESKALLNNQNFLQALTLVRALALRPRILLLNNVTATMDETTKSHLAGILAELKGSTTMVISSMDTLLTRLADVQLCLETGKEKMVREWHEDNAGDRASSLGTTWQKRAG